MAANGSHPQDHEAIPDHSVSFCQSVVVSYKRFDILPAPWGGDSLLSSGTWLPLLIQVG